VQLYVVGHGTFILHQTVASGIRYQKADLRGFVHLIEAAAGTLSLAKEVGRKLNGMLGRKTANVLQILASGAGHRLRA